jgi:hypothetical protein
MNELVWMIKKQFVEPFRKIKYFSLGEDKNDGQSRVSLPLSTFACENPVFFFNDEI